TDALNEKARVRHHGFNGGSALPNRSSTLAHPKGTELPAMPCRAGAAHFFGAPEFLLVSFAGGGKINAEQLGSEQSNNYGRAHGPKHIGNRVGYRHGVEQRLSLISRQPKPVESIGGEAHCPRN